MAKFTEFEPNVSFRFRLVAPAFSGIQFLCKAINLPSIDQGEIVMDYINTDFKVKGKSRWQDVTLQIYDAVGLPNTSSNSGAAQIHDWLLKHHNSNSGVDGWAYPNNSGYKQQWDIEVLNPQGSLVYSWKLYGAFMSAINFGDMDWAAEDAVIAEITIKYDYAIHIG